MLEIYDWNNKLIYLKNMRDLYYNDDYVSFLVNIVWKIIKFVYIVDYGCGYGYLGLVLMLLFLEGLKYIGIDSGEILLVEVRELFCLFLYDLEFFEGDVIEIELNDKYDIVICYVFLLYMIILEIML